MRRKALFGSAVAPHIPPSGAGLLHLNEVLEHLLPVPSAVVNPDRPGAHGMGGKSSALVTACLVTSIKIYLTDDLKLILSTDRISR